MDLGSIPGSGRSSGEGNGNPLQYSCLENLMDREAWWATIHGVAKSRTWLSKFTFTFTSSLEKCLFSSLAPFLIELFVSLVLSYMSCLYIFWRLILCQLFHLLLFPPILKAALSTLLIVSFIVEKLLSLVRSHLFIFAFIAITLGGGS